MIEGSRLARSGSWVLVATVAAAALAAGTVHTTTLCAVAAALWIAVALIWWDAERTDFRPRLAATILLVTGVALTTYTALQTVPMPIGWLTAIAPHNADVWSRSLTPLHEGGPGWAPISLDPTATRIEVLKGITYLLAFVAAWRIARTRDGIKFLSTALVVTGAVLAASALLHPAFGAHKLYGIWKPSDEVLAFGGKHVAPFINPNNLAAYLNVAFCLAFATTLAPEPHWPRPLVAAATVLLASTQVCVGSRGGVASMILGAVLVLVISRAHRSTSARRHSGGISMIVALVFTAGVAMIALASSKQSSNELFDSDLSKFGLFRQAIKMIPAYPIWGTGRGAFESTFPAFRESQGLPTFTHPENVVAQWLVEWGVPVGAGGLVAIVFGLRPNTVLARSSTAAGAWAAIVAVAVQNLVDLGSEVPGLVLAPVVCAAIVVGGTAGRSTRWLAERWGQSPRVLAMTAGVASLLGICGAATAIGGELAEDRDLLHDAAVGATTTKASIHSMARAAMLRHPGEPYLPLMVGWRAAREHDDDPMAWIEATLERSRIDAPAHLVLARLLAKRSPSQARLEYRLAVEQSSEFVGIVSYELPRIVGGYYDAMEAVSDGKAGVYTLQELSAALASRLPATSTRLDDEIAARSPMDPGPALRAARSAVADLDAGESAPWCDGNARDACVKYALEASAHAALLAPATCEPHVLRARARMATSDAKTALAELAAAVDSVGDPVVCLQAQVELAGKAKDDKRASDALAKIAAVGCSDDTECATNLAWVAAAEEHRGAPGRALALYKRAYGRSPGNDGLLESAARLAGAAGLHAEAQSDYEQLARKHPDDARWRAAAEAEHSAALRAAAAL
jgi:tetratricopeptide (TPR) repeat protein